MKGLILNFFLTFFSVAFAVAILLGIRHFLSTSRVHSRFKAQLKSKYNLRNGKLFSVQSTDGRKIWFSIPGREYFTGLATYGQDTLENPSYCGISVCLDSQNKFAFDFMLLNQNKPTQRISFMPYGKFESEKLHPLVTKYFHVVAKGKDLTQPQVASLNKLGTSLSSVLHDQTRYEVAYRNNTLTVYIGAHSIETFGDLDRCYQLAMTCMDILDKDQESRC